MARTRKTVGEGSASSVLLRLYIAGGTPNSLRAQTNLSTALRELHSDGGNAAGFDVEVVDVFKAPMRALDDEVIVTPTLMAIGGRRRQVVAGNLSDTESLKQFLSGALAVAASA